MKLFKFLIIPLLLIIGYLIIVSYPYFSSKITRFSSLGLLSLVEEKSEGIKKTGKAEEHLVKGEKIIGKLRATENNLGIVLVRFAQLALKVSDTVMFRIKQEGQEKWYYENNYRANQFQSNEYFTFGFPPIPDSRDKEYIFEIESLTGTDKNGVGISLQKPQVALVYKYIKEDLKNFNTLFPFIFKKLVYVASNINILQRWQPLAAFLLILVSVILVTKKRAVVAKVKRIYIISKKASRSFASTNFYSLFLNTSTKKRVIIGLSIFLFALIHRYSSLLVNQPLLFYAGLGGQGDYDQFIRAATCAVRDFYSCPLVLHQNLLIESSVLGTFYQIFGFIGGLKVYLYFMLIVSSLVATLPYILLSRKSWVSTGGIIGGLFLANSDFLTQVALSFPPDNLSLFTFSIFYIVYLLTIHIGIIRWLLFFGLVGLIDGMNKALFLINDLVVFVLFIPVFFFEKAKKSKGTLFNKKNTRILLISVLPVLVFLIIYSAWEYFVYVKWTAYYFLRSLVETRGISFVSYTSFSGSSLTGNILLDLFYLCVSTLVMLKRLIEYADLQIIFLAPIFFGLLLLSFLKASRNLITKRFVFALIFSVVMIALLTLVKNNYFKIHEIFAAEYIFANWTDKIYINVFLLSEILMLFILNFKYSAIKLSLPIIPYIIMLIILTKNSPFPRISTQVVVWNIILLAYIIDFLLMNADRYSRKGIKIMLAPVFLISFICLYSLPGMLTMITQLNSGATIRQSQASYLKWAEESLPENAVILAGGKSDLVVLAENVKRPIIYSTLYSAALLIKPNEIPGISPTDFTIIGELQNKNNFKKNKYMILEDDIYLWRGRLNGVADGVFTADPSIATALHGDDYSIEVYKSNPTLKKAIYELSIQENESIN